MLTKLLAQIQNSHFVFSSNGIQGDIEPFKSLWRKVFDENDVAIQGYFLDRLKTTFMANDQMLEIITEDLLNHPNEKTRLSIAEVVASKPYRMPMGEKFNAMIEKSLSDPNQRIRMRILDALSVYLIIPSGAKLTPGLIEKSLKVLGEVLAQKEADRYEVSAVIKVLGSRVAFYAKEINQVLLREEKFQQENFKHSLMRSLVFTGPQFYQFFPAIRTILNQSKDYALQDSIMHTLYTIARCKPVHCPQIIELIPDLESYYQKYSEEWVKNIIEAIQSGPILDQVAYGY